MQPLDITYAPTFSSNKLEYLYSEPIKIQDINPLFTKVLRRYVHSISFAVIEIIFPLYPNGPQSETNRGGWGEHKAQSTSRMR